MGLENALEKLYLAVRSMVGPEGIRDRIIGAYQYNLIHITPKTDLPDPLKNEFERIMQELSPNESPGVVTTVGKMSVDKVTEIARFIVDIYNSVAEELAKSRT